MKKIITLVLAAVMLLCVFSGCSAKSGGQFTDKTITLELYPDIAPITVANFVKLAEEGFYDGLTFHRVVPGFVIQGGDPQGTGMGGSDPIKGEFSENGVENDLAHVRGVISMARRGDSYDSGSCQFFICHQDARPSLDGKYAGFGRVTEGMDVVDAIAAVELVPGLSGSLDKPKVPVVMKTIEVVDKEATGANGENIVIVKIIFE